MCLSTKLAKSSKLTSCWEIVKGRPTTFRMGCCIGSNLFFITILSCHLQFRCRDRLQISTVFASHTQGSRNDPNPRLRKLYNREISTLRRTSEDGSEIREKGKTFLTTKNTKKFQDFSFQDFSLFSVFFVIICGQFIFGCGSPSQGVFKAGAGRTGSPRYSRLTIDATLVAQTGSLPCRRLATGSAFRTTFSEFVKGPSLTQILA